MSGEVHGDERVGPTAVIELILLIIKNRKLPWMNHILNHRMIVLTPITNPHGYANNIREELLISDENDWTLTNRNTRYNTVHKDINRDFPYLVKDSECMETIGARVVNELYLSHMFSLALSLHGGTESLTYPYGTPNHLVNGKKIPMDYKLVKGKLKNKPNSLTHSMANTFKSKVYDEIEGRGTPTPDNAGIVSK